MGYADAELLAATRCGHGKDAKSKNDTHGNGQNELGRQANMLKIGRNSFPQLGPQVVISILDSPNIVW